MKWFISILVFFMLFILLFIVVPILTGTKDIKEPVNACEIISCNYSAPCEKCGDAYTPYNGF